MNSNLNPNRNPSATKTKTKASENQKLQAWSLKSVVVGDSELTNSEPTFIFSYDRL